MSLEPICLYQYIAMWRIIEMKKVRKYFATLPVVDGLTVVLLLTIAVAGLCTCGVACWCMVVPAILTSGVVVLLLRLVVDGVCDRSLTLPRVETLVELALPLVTSPPKVGLTVVLLLVMIAGD